MESTHEPADPIAKGVIPTAIQSIQDLFTWKQRVVVTNSQGETTCEWAKPVPLKNPVSLLAQLSAKDWVFFIVGFAAWTADVSYILEPTPIASLHTAKLPLMDCKRHSISTPSVFKL